MQDMFGGTEASVLALRTPHEYDPVELPYWKRFVEALYDWSDVLFIQKNRRAKSFAYRMIPLTRGYFMIVSACDYKRMTQYPNGSPKKWCARVDYDRQTGEIVKVYGVRSGRKIYDEPSTVLAHREVMSLHNPDTVDHVNGWGLDNRRCNLHQGSQRLNMSNTVRTRSVHAGLLPGVERRKKRGDGRVWYGGIRARRLSRHKVKVFRSKKSWLSQEPAAAWYRNQLKKLHKRVAWASDPRTVNYPLFPPTKAQVIIAREQAQTNDLVATF